MEKELSEKSKEILCYIVDYKKIHGYPPTVREIGKMVGLASTSTVHGQLTVLDARGYIRKAGNQPRTLEVTQLGLSEVGMDGLSIPRVEMTSKGLSGEEEGTEYSQVPPQFVDHPQYDSESLVRVMYRGESMRDAGIIIGDELLVHPQKTAEKGDLILVKGNEKEVRCMQISSKENGIYVLKSNEDEVVREKKELLMLGKVLGLYRTF